MKFIGLSEQIGQIVGRGRMAGVASLVWRRGETVHMQMTGCRNLVTGTPVERDSLFRIASMTKPIVSAAALMLVDEGRLGLASPLHRWLPEMADLRVLRHPGGQLEDTAPLERAPTVFDLLTHTAGFAWSGGLDAPITHAVGAACEQRPLISCGPDTFVQRMAALPLIQQPGRGWYYSVATDLLGVVLARASGLGLSDLLTERVFEPLGMVDTGFWVPESKLHRLAEGYSRDLDGRLAVHDPAVTGAWSRPPAFPSGGGGLVSTLDDYLSFARMLLNQGTLGHRRLLSEQSAAAMISNHLSPEQIRPLHPSVNYLHGQGFGLGVSIALGSEEDRRRPGSFGWPGAYSTAWFADPKENLIALAMGQLWLDPANELRGALEEQVYGELEASSSQQAV